MQNHNNTVNCVWDWKDFIQTPSGVVAIIFSGISIFSMTLVFLGLMFIVMRYYNNWRRYRQKQNEYFAMT